MPPLQRLPPTAVQAVGVAGVEALYGAYGVYALQGQSVGGYVGRDAVTLCDGDDLLYGVIDARDALGGPCLVVPLELIGDVYESASASPCRASRRILFALPAMMEQRKFGSEMSLTTAPRAHGARMSQGRKRISSGSTGFAPNVLTMTSTALRSMSVTIKLDPSRW